VSERIDQDDWVDQDLLTKAEAAERLAEEIDDLIVQLPGTEGVERELLTRRLTALRESREAMTTP
jgi:hypothetical protein